jgi:hypothetical protein
VGPMLHGSHSFMEMPFEDGPVRAIGLKLRYVGWELFDGEGRRHFSSSCNSVFIGS